MDKKILSTGAIFGIIAIILGAFGAHALKKILPVEALVTFETGVRYQMYHALFLLFLGSLNDFPQKNKKINLVFNCFRRNLFFWLYLFIGNKQPYFI